MRSAILAFPERDAITGALLPTGDFSQQAATKKAQNPVRNKPKRLGRPANWRSSFEAEQLWNL